MRRRSGSVGIGLGAALLLGLGLAGTPAPAGAQVACPPADPAGDPDGDGLSNAEECSLVLNDASGVPFCDGSQARRDCVDPNTPDVFFVLDGPTNVPSGDPGTSRRPVDPLRFFDQATGGLGITPHEVTLAQLYSDVFGRLFVTPSQSQSVILFIEDHNLSDGEWGQSSGLVRDGNQRAFWFARRIERDITNIYADKGETVPAGIFEKAHRQVLAHEGAHALRVLRIFTRRYEDHSPPGDPFCVMDQFVVFDTKGKGPVQEHIPTQFCDPSASDADFAGN